MEVPCGSTTYRSVSVACALPAIDSRIEVGADNVFDKLPPLMYQHNVLNAGTGVSTFDPSAATSSRAIP